MKKDTPLKAMKISFLIGLIMVPIGMYAIHAQNEFLFRFFIFLVMVSFMCLFAFGLIPIIVNYMNEVSSEDDWLTRHFKIKKEYKKFILFDDEKE